MKGVDGYKAPLGRRIWMNHEQHQTCHQLVRPQMHRSDPEDDDTAFPLMNNSDNLNGLYDLDASS